MGMSSFRQGVASYTAEDGAVTWYIRYREGRGRKFPPLTEKLENCRNRNDALGVLAGKKAKVFDGTYRAKATREPTTIVDFLDRFEAAKSDKPTVRRYLQQIRWIFDNVDLARAPIASWTIDTAEMLYLELKKRHDTTATANAYFNAVKSELTIAERKGLIDSNPLVAVKITEPNNKRRRLLSDEEVARLITEALKLGDHVRPIFFGLLYTGWRVGELLGLRREQLDFANGLIVLDISKTGEGRVVPMHQHLGGEWDRWIKICGESDWLFPFTRWRVGQKQVTVRPKKALTYSGVKKGWKKLREAAKIPDHAEGFTRHHMRHWFVSTMLRHGTRSAAVAELVGHKSPATQARYTHAFDPDKIAALNLLPATSIYLPFTHAKEMK